MATLKDIAALAGVSQGTVSNVLNGRGNVSSEKIRLVEAAAAQLGYAVNERAKLLRKGSSDILALVIPNIRFREYDDIYTSFRIAAEKSGYTVSLYLTDDSPIKETQIISRLRSEMAAGVAVISCLGAQSAAYHDAGFAPEQLLFLERRPSGDSNYIGFDYRRAGEALGKKAAAQGKPIVLLTGKAENSKELDFRAGFYSALSDVQRAHVRELRTSEQQRSQKMLRFFGEITELPALLASESSIAEASAELCSSFFPELAQAPIYTMSPLCTLPEKRFIKYELNDRLLGHSAAGQLIRQLKEAHDRPCELILRSDGFRDWSPAVRPAPSGEALNLLMLNGPEAHATQSLARLYTQNTGVPINISVFSYDEIYEILSTTGGAAFDILRIDITFLSWFAEKLLCPLRELDTEIDALLPQFLDGVSRRYAMIGNEIYALPFSPSVQLLYYRKDLFESNVLRRVYQERFRCELLPPEAFKQFNHIAAFFTRQLNPQSPVPYGASLTLGSIGVAGSEFMARYLEKHQNLYAADGRVRLNDAAGQEAMRQLVELRGYAPVSGTDWWTDTARSFASGELAMAILYSNYASDLLKGDTVVSDNIGYTFVPGHNPVLGGASLGISKFSSKKDSALRFLKWLCQEPVASALTYLGSAPAQKRTYENYSLLDSYPWLSLASESFSFAQGYRRPRGDLTPFDERTFLNIIGVAVKNACRGIQSPEQALDWAQAEYDRNFGQL